MEINYLEELKVSRLRYLVCQNELEKILHELKDYDKIISLNYRKVGMYKFIKTLFPSFNILYEVSTLNSIAPLLTLNRMIIDHYAVFYLLTTHSTEQERNIRYYLYLIDGITTRSNVVNDFHSDVSKNTFEHTHNKIKSVISCDSESINQVGKYIAENNLDGYTSERVIKDKNWKFIDPKSNKSIRDNSYGWIKLYNLARIPKHYSSAFQKYYSSYVHGLGITLMSQSDEDKLPLICSTLSLTSIIQSLVIKILLVEYKDKVNENLINQDFSFYMNSNWEKWNQ